MSLKIRLAKIGRRGKSVFRIVVAPVRSKRGKSLDILGLYDLTVNPPQIKLDQNKYQKWLKVGAQLSEGLRKVLAQTKEK